MPYTTATSPSDWVIHFGNWYDQESTPRENLTHNESLQRLWESYRGWARWEAVPLHLEDEPVKQKRPLTKMCK